PLDHLLEAAGPAAPLHNARELGLATRPTLVDDEMLRGVARHVGAEIVLDQREREIDAGRDAGGRPDRAVADEDAIGIEPHLRVPDAEMIRAVPVRGGAAAVESSSLCQKERAGADARDPARRRSLQPPDDLLCGRG